MKLIWESDNYSKTYHIGCNIRGVQHNGRRPDIIEISLEELNMVFDDDFGHPRNRNIKWFSSVVMSAIDKDGSVVIK